MAALGPFRLGGGGGGAALPDSSLALKSAAAATEAFVFSFLLTLR
jgi:hypothetical protein